jgi:hypothetical protein
MPVKRPTDKAPGQVSSSVRTVSPGRASARKIVISAVCPPETA